MTLRLAFSLCLAPIFAETALADQEYYPTEWAVSTVPFLGIWAGEPEWCARAYLLEEDPDGKQVVPENGPWPIAIRQGEISGYENHCDINAFYQIAETAAWFLPLTCHAEGDTYDEHRLILHTTRANEPDLIWIWFGGEEPVQFTQCETAK